MRPSLSNPGAETTPPNGRTMNYRELSTQPKKYHQRKAKTIKLNEQKILYKLSQPHGDNMVYIGDAALKMHILKQTAWRCVPCVSKVFETKLPSLRGEIDCMGVHWWRSAQDAHFETDGAALCAVCFKSLRDEAPVASWRNGLYGVYWSYNGYAMRQVSVNSTSLYETN